MSDPEPYVIEVAALRGKQIYKRFVFTAEGFSIEKNRSFDPPVFIPADQMQAIRLGHRWIRGRYFAIGQHYAIELKHHDNNQVTGIKLNSYYRIRRSTYSNAWNSLYQNLYNYYFKNSVKLYFELYQMR